jgi:hypothetical protein
VIRRPREASLHKKRSLAVGGRATSVAIEDAFWDSLKEIATHEAGRPDRCCFQNQLGRPARPSYFKRKARLGDAPGEAPRAVAAGARFNCHICDSYFAGAANGRSAD